jgi:hypothetical protein
MIRIFAFCLSLLLFGAPIDLIAKPVTELDCIDKLFTDEERVSWAKSALGVEEAGKPIDYLRLADGARDCAAKGNWTENEAENAMAYENSIPVAQGLRILKKDQGYDAIDRYYDAHLAELTPIKLLNQDQLATILKAAMVDGLKFDESSEAQFAARKYVEVIHAVHLYRSNFENDLPVFSE